MITGCRSISAAGEGGGCRKRHVASRRTRHNTDFSQQVLKAIWQKPASPSSTDRSIVFVRRRQCGPHLMHGSLNSHKTSLPPKLDLLRFSRFCTDHPLTRISKFRNYRSTCSCNRASGTHFLSNHSIWSKLTSETNFSTPVLQGPVNSGLSLFAMFREILTTAHKPSQWR